jgi:mannan endo-1,4-beta-mannosidase
MKTIYASGLFDHATIHIWPQNWGWYYPKFPKLSYPLAKLLSGLYLKIQLKLLPKNMGEIFVEEYGLARDLGSLEASATTYWRKKFFHFIYEEVKKYRLAGYPITKLMPWSYAGVARPHTQDLLGDPNHEPQGWYSIYDVELSELKETLGDF